jgi:hypothetical protein
MSTNTSYIKSFYTSIAQKVPLLLPYQFLITISCGETDTRIKNAVKWENLQLLCQSASIPQSTLNTQDVSYFGKRFTIPTTQQNQHKWNTTLIITNEMTAYNELRNLMLLFSNLENNMGGIRTIPNIDVIVEVLNQFSEVDVTQPRVILKDAYPTNLAQLDFDYKGDATVMTPQVTFTYQYSFFDMVHDRQSSDSLKSAAPVFNT